MSSKRDKLDKRPRSIALIEKRVKRRRKRREGEGPPTVLKTPKEWKEELG